MSVRYSVSVPASAGTSALPVASITFAQRTAPRVPSDITTTTPVTRVPSTITPWSIVPNQISAPARRCSCRYHSLFACGNTAPIVFTPSSISCVKPTRLPK